MSKIEVNTIEPQCGTTVTVGKCTSTVAVPGNVVKSNALQASDAGNIISQSGTTVTLGASGDTVALASGASQTGFGRTGTVDWDTSIHTGTVTAATGKGYFVNTTSGGITVNLPAAAVGSIVAVSDYASTAASNNITVAPNGSEKINGVNDDYTISTAGLAVTFVYADATRGWKSVTGSDADATGETPAYIVATGGNQPTAGGCIVCTNYKVHEFTGPGTLCVSAAGNSAGSNTIDYLVVAGGGGGAHGQTCRYTSGAGGAGGARMSPGTASGCYTASPLGTAPAVAVTATVQGYPITVGGGGAGACSGSSPVPGNGTAGGASSALCISSAGGGSGSGAGGAGGAGGSGGGGSGSGAGGAGDTPDVTPNQGFAGGTGCGSWGGGRNAGGGGGGASTVGADGSSPVGGGAGGAGITQGISGSDLGYAGGASGSSFGTQSSTPFRPFGGGIGWPNPTPGDVPGVVLTGGGGGGGAYATAPSFSGGGSGGSGTVIIRYKFQ